MDPEALKPIGRNLRKLLFRNRKVLRELEAEGISRYELRNAVRTIRDDGEFPKDEDHTMLAALIAAELASNPEVQLPTGVNWDKIIELINQLMPLIEMWLSMCAI